MNDIGITVRAYAAGTDLKRLSGIWSSVTLNANAFIGEKRQRKQRRRVEEEYLPNAETWAACLGDGAAGFISLLGSFVGGLFIAPGQQGRCIGRIFVQHAARLKGELELDVYTRNRRALGFHKTLGSIKMGRSVEDNEGLPFKNVRLLFRQ